MNRKKDIEQLFRQHYAKMYNLARCILSDDDESKDVVSEVFAQILADDVVLVPGSEDGYLMRSVRNRCLNLIAHKSVKERVAKLLLDDADVILSEETDERLDRLMLLIEDLEPPIRQLIFRLLIRFLSCQGGVCGCRCPAHPSLLQLEQDEDFGAEPGDFECFRPHTDRVY